MSKIKFSIILPTYNRAIFISKAIESVLAQTYTNWELIIIDDGSTDNTQETLNQFKDERIFYYYQENQERSTARNNGIEKATGDYICFLDSDDYYLPQKLQAHHDAIENNGFKNAVYYEGIIFEDAETLKRTKIELPLQLENENIYEFLIQNPLGSMQLSIPSSVLAKERFNSEIKIGEDVELWMRLAKSIIFIPIYDTYYSVAIEHQNRSINNLEIAKINHLLTVKHIINESFELISSKVKKRVLSDAYFGVAKSYIRQDEKLNSINWITKSILKDFKNKQTKHRLYCLKQLLLNLPIQEYQVK